MTKLRVGLLFGGRSVEHEVSIASATSIWSALDRDRYDAVPLAIDHDGCWHRGDPDEPLERALNGPELTVPVAPSGGALLPIGPGSDALEALQLDVIFPIVHGRGGEDGSLQGVLEMAEIPYVGSGVLGSSVQMDKDVAKRLLAAEGVPVVPWRTLPHREVGREQALAAAADELDFPVFAKPANSGSSVGIGKASDLAELRRAVADAARFDTKIVIEKGIDAREIEVAVIGHHTPEASVPGEIVPSHEFYDYEAKYSDDATQLLIPAPIDESDSKHIRELATRAFSILESSGLARVDFLLDRNNGEFYVNEVNSLPGFTDSSMFPRLWEATGLTYPKLLDRLIELAQQRHQERAALITHYQPAP
jgi:D-alanine-D-alanine ligase